VAEPKSKIDRHVLYSGTEEPPKHLALDASTLGAYLRKFIDGLGSNFSVEKFKGGQSNPTYKLTNHDNGACYVLRRRPPGELLASAHDVKREFKVISALSTVKYPVPTPYHFCEDKSVIGSEFYVVSYSEGRVFWNNDLPNLSPYERTEIYTNMASWLARLHSIDFNAVGLGDLGRTENYLVRNFNRWSKLYEQSKLVEIPDMDWLIKKISELMPPEGKACLLHGDYGLYNLIIDPEKPKIKAVLDWEMSTLGDPFVDLAHHLRAWWEPVDHAGASSSLQGKDLPALGIPSMDDYIDNYCRAVGVSEIPYRSFYLGYAQFRYAAMVQGILKRAASGTASSRRVLHRQERVLEIAALARRTLQTN